MRPGIYSKARIAGHPIHPMLVHFPITLFLAGLVSLFIYAGSAELFWYRVSYIALLAGAVTATLAAVVGSIDLFGGIPANSPARKTGLKHMGLNVIALALFTVAGILMFQSLDDGGELAVNTPLALSVIGAIVLGVSGTLGSKLAYKHHVGQQINEDLTFHEDVRDDVLPHAGVHRIGGDDASSHRPHLS